MSGAEALTTISQIALGLAGFTGILVALGRSPGRADAPEAMRLQSLLACSFGAMFLSLLPFALHEAGLAEPLLWRLQSAILAGFTAIYIGIYDARRIRAYRGQAGRAPSPAVFLLIGLGSLASLCVQLLNALGVVFEPGVAAYLFGLYWLLVVAAVQFTRILFVRPEA